MLYLYGILHGLTKQLSDNTEKVQSSSLSLLYADLSYTEKPWKEQISSPLNAGESSCTCLSLSRTLHTNEQF